MNNIALAVIAFVIVIGPLILIHELGHFIAARLIGVTVLEFGIGFPPRALKLFEQGGTEFTLNWLPIGGFVRPLGEDFVRPVGDAATDEERLAFEKRQNEQSSLQARNIKTKSVMEAGPWQRIFFMIAGVLMNLLAGLILFALASLVGIPVLKSATVAVRGIAPNSTAAQAGLQVGDVITGVNGHTIAFSDDLQSALVGKTGVAVPLTVKRGDQTLSVSLASTAAAPISGMSGVFIMDVNAGSPGEKAGLKYGDHVLKMDDQVISVTNDLFTFDNAHLGKSVLMTFERDGKTQTVTIQMNAQAPAIGAGIATLPDDAIGKTDEPSKKIIVILETTGLELLNLNPITKVEAQPIGVAISDGFAGVWNVIASTVTVPIRIIRGQLSVQQARPASIVGISGMGAQVIQQSVDLKQSYPLLNFAAVISVAIGITQLLPIPGLDGGRILFVLIELLRGKPLKPEREGMVHLIGLLLLLGFMAIFIVNDVLNPILLPK